MGKFACVIGDPIGHSRSPLIHGYWLSRYGVSGSYDRVRVTPEELGAFLDRVRSGELVGCNVTVPHKEAVAKAVDRLTPTAGKLGAVNTIWTENGLLWGDNTDVAGFLGNLDERHPGWDNGGDAVVLGAGGAARAIVHGLMLRRFARITIVNRSEDRARALAEALREYGSSRLDVAAWDDRDGALKGAGFLVNTTSLGMSGQPPLDIDLAALSSDAVVNDIVYAPVETGLLRAAGEGGLAAVDGLGMLLHQAAPGFQRWFGVLPEVTDELRQIIIDDMNGH